MTLTPGDRVRVGGAAATVRYVGPVHGKGDAPWVGLEWDDAARGKHGGAVAGRRYFGVRPDAPTSGSLVRASALTAVIERGIDLEAALTARYAGGGDGGGAVVGGDAVAQRQARLGELEVASVAGMAVAGATPALASLTPSLVELDASRTLLPGWPALASLAAALPRLARLDATATPLHLAPPPPELPPFTALTTLVLAETGATWGAAMAAAAAAPRLRALSLRACGLVGLAPAPGADDMTCLTELDVSENPFTDGGWHTLESVGRLPQLRRLDAARCAGVTALAPRDAPFAALTSLCLDGAPLAEWGSIGALATFPTLRSVRLAGVPLPPPTPSAGDARADIVARLPPTVASLNGAPLSDFERRDAARALAAAAARAAAGPPPAPGPLAMVTLELAGDAAGPPARRVKLPLSTPLGRVRTLAAKIVSCPAAPDLTLHRRDAPPELLARGDDGRDLAFLGVGDGDRVVVG